MPALFAYLVAVVLLVSGGYGALNWLAAPEPIKVAAKVKPKAVPHYQETPPIADSATASVTASSAANAPATEESKDTASRDTTSEQTASATDASENKQASEQPDRDKPTASVPGEDSTIRTARAEAPAAGPSQIVPETKREASKAVPPSPSRPDIQQSSARAQTVASVDSAAGTKPVNRPRLNQTSRRSERTVSAERRPLTLMTLRTIEFPDGRRATRLIPYRDAARNLDD